MTSIPARRSAPHADGPLNRRFVRYTHGEMRFAVLLLLPLAALTASAATVAEARAFIDKAEQEVYQLSIMGQRTGWVQETYITDDTEALAASGEEATAAYVTDAIQKAHRFDGVRGIDPVTARQLLLLKLAQTVPAPSNTEERRELAVRGNNAELALALVEIESYRIHEAAGLPVCASSQDGEHVNPCGANLPPRCRGGPAASFQLNSGR